MPETKTLTLPHSKKAITYKPYITAGVWMDLQEKIGTKKQTFLVESIISEYDGSSENIVKRMRDELLARDYVLVEKTILEVLAGETGGEDKKKAL